MSKFPSRLKEIRIARGKSSARRPNISQQALAGYLGVSRWSVHNYEAGKNRPDYARLIQLVDYFEVSLDYLDRAVGLGEGCYFLLVQKVTNVPRPVGPDALIGPRPCLSSSVDHPHPSRLRRANFPQGKAQGHDGGMGHPALAVGA